MTAYRKIDRKQIPAAVRFDVPSRNRGQAEEVAYGGFGRAQHDDGAPYKRVIDRAAHPFGGEDSADYYALESAGGKGRAA